MSQKTERICNKGHHYFKSSDCPTCPVCEEERKSEAGIFAILSAPARRAMENNRITSLEELAQHSEKEETKVKCEVSPVMDQIMSFFIEIGTQYDLRDQNKNGRNKKNSSGTRQKLKYSFLKKERFWGSQKSQKWNGDK